MILGYLRIPSQHEWWTSPCAWSIIIIPKLAGSGWLRGWGSAKINFRWRAQHKRHVLQSCEEVRALISWEGFHFGSSDLQVFWNYFAWQVQRFVSPGITFSWQAQYFRQVGWEIAKRIGTRPSPLHWTFHFWRKARRIASFLTSSTFWKMKKTRRIGRNASFLTLSCSNMEEVSQNWRRVLDVANFEQSRSSQNSFVFKLADRQIGTR